MQRIRRSSDGKGESVAKEEISATRAKTFAPKMPKTTFH